MLDAYQAAQNKPTRQRGAAPRKSTTAASQPPTKAARREPLIPPDPPLPAVAPSRVAALGKQLQELTARVKQLEQADGPQVTGRKKLLHRT